MWKYVFSTLLIAFAWAAVRFLHLPPWYGIVFTVVQALISAVIFVVRVIRSRNAAKKLERALGAQADEQARLARPEQKAEVVALKGEFLKAVGALKASRLGKGGTSALYALPWYMIIGPPGAGKSTALRNSGLQFPYLSATGGAVRGIGGTRNCDWWLTNEAILLDTAGRYTSDEDDKDEWLSFLDLLRASRPRKPVNGIFVAVSIAEIARASDEELQALSHRLRERIDEVIERLQLVAPVYLLLTKCDLIEGFTDLFGDLKKSDRGQIWGFTLPVDHKDQRPIIDIAGARFDELHDNIKKRAMRRLGQERRIEARERIYGFPQQFAFLRPQLGSFLSTLFTANVYKETPLIRGVYFTSGTQEGRPIDRVMSAMAEAFGVAPQLPAQEPVVESKSYFLRDFFYNVVFPDKSLAVRTRLAVARQRNRTYAIGAAAFGLALMVSSFPAYSYVKNRELIGSTADIVGQVAGARSGSTPGALSLDQLEALRARVDLLRRYHVDAPPTELRFGLYRGDDLYGSVSKLYADVLRDDIIAPIVWKTAQDMTAFARDPQPGNYDPALYDRLKLYLLLTGPHAADEPAAAGKLLDWTVDGVVNAWAKSIAAGGELSEAQRTTMKQHARLYVQLAAADPGLALQRDLELVQHVRIGLAKMPLEKVVLDPLVASMSQEGYDLNLKSILGGAPGPIESKAIIRGAFTKLAWKQKIGPRLAEAAGFAEPWVLGKESARQGSSEDQARALRSKYFEMYIQEWQAFLSSLRVRTVYANTDVLTMLQALTRGTTPPYGAIINVLNDNTSLADAADRTASLVDKATQVAGEQVAKRGGVAASAVAGALSDATATRPDGLLTEADVAAAFAGLTSFGVAPPPPPGAPPASGKVPVELDAYQEQIVFVRDAMQAFIQDPKELAGAKAKIATAKTVVRGLIEAQAVGWRPRFEALLWPPIDLTWSAVNITDVKTKGLPWCNEVVIPFDRGLKGKYPFNPDGHDVSLADLADFYKPDGILWKHFDAQFADSILRMGDQFQFAPGVAGYSGSLLAFLARAQEITTVLFPSGAKDPVVEFEVSIHPNPEASSISFDVDGQSVRTQNEPSRWFKMHWPGESRHGASIQVKGRNNLAETLRQDGDWGLFRLLEQGKAEASLSSRTFTVTWPLSSRPGVSIVFDIRPTRNEAPFFGTSRRAAKLMAPFRRGDVNPPHAIHPGDACNVH